MPPKSYTLEQKQEMQKKYVDKNMTLKEIQALYKINENKLRKFSKTDWYTNKDVSWTNLRNIRVTNNKRIEFDSSEKALKRKKEKQLQQSAQEEHILTKAGYNETSEKVEHQEITGIVEKAKIDEMISLQITNTKNQVNAVTNELQRVLKDNSLTPEQKDKKHIKLFNELRCSDLNKDILLLRRAQESLYKESKEIQINLQQNNFIQNLENLSVEQLKERQKVLEKEIKKIGDI